MTMTDRFFTIVFLAIFFMAMWIVYGHSAAGLVGMLEMRYGTPGSTRVLPECGCTVRYVGTRVAGTDYFVHLKKLD